MKNVKDRLLVIEDPPFCHARLDRASSVFGFSSVVWEGRGTTPFGFASFDFASFGFAQDRQDRRCAQTVFAAITEWTGPGRSHARRRREAFLSCPIEPGMTEGDDEKCQRLS